MFTTGSEAKAVLNALIPDNVNFPAGLFMRMFSRGRSLVIEITGKNVSMATILSTLDEALEHISVSVKVMRAG